MVEGLPSPDSENSNIDFQNLNFGELEKVFQRNSKIGRDYVSSNLG